MGGTSSHESEMETPPKVTTQSRLLEIDPRSPSYEISRTPIVVDKTPENTLDSALDPRSPTVGIVRTPLAYVPPRKLDLEETNDSMMVQVDFPSNIPSPELILAQDLAHCQDLERRPTETDPLAIGDIQNLSLDDFPISESTRLVPVEQEETAGEADKQKTKKKNSRVAQPKELFPPKAVKGLKESTRSPLSTRNIDMNSPLHIVQKKQSEHIDKARNCQIESGNSRFIVRDKENM